MKDATGKEMKPTGRKFGYWFGHVIDVDPDKEQVQREYGVSDGSTMAVQLGLAKMPARAVMKAVTAPATVVVAANDAREANNIAADRAAFDAWNKHDGPKAASYNAPGFVLHDATSPKDQNAADNKLSNDDFWRGFGDAHLATRFWAAGDYVVVEGRFEGTNDGDFVPMKLNKTGRKVSLPFLEIDRFVDGKVKEGWLIFDTADFAKQLLGPAAK
jgi:hypothetical protein